VVNGRPVIGLGLLTERVLGLPRNPTDAQIRLMLPVAGVSGFLNNTPVVAMFMPVIADWCKKTGISLTGGLRARRGVQPHQRLRGPRCPQRGRAVPDVEHAQAQRVAVERDRAPEVRRLKSHATHPGARRQTRAVHGFLPPGLRMRDGRS
jgi:hypothetical protein